MTPRRTVGSLVRLADLASGRTPGSRRFLAGITAGSLVGAALAGSLVFGIRDRRTAGAKPRATPPDPEQQAARA